MLMAHTAAAAASATFSRPAEWDRQSHVIMAWPGHNDYYTENPGDLKPATKEISAIAEAVALFEPVTLLVNSDQLDEAKKRFKKSGQITLVPVPIDEYALDLWMRDMAPTYVVDSVQQALSGVDYNFNGWGGKYPVDADESLASIILNTSHVPQIASTIVTEGGSLEVDGEGTLIITESSILNSNRNPKQSRADVEAELRHTLGVEHIIWIPGRKGLDVTDCHIDGLARFISPGCVLLSKPNEPDNGPWTQIYNEARQILSDATDARGQRLEVVEITEASMYSIGLDGRTLQDIEDGKEDAPALNYVNYLLVNDGVIFPQFGDKKADVAALKVMKSLYPDRDVEPVFITELPMLGGGIHCSTQEVPLART